MVEEVFAKFDQEAEVAVAWIDSRLARALEFHASELDRNFVGLVNYAADRGILP